MSSVWESFLNAAQQLSSAGPIKQRLAAAYATHLAGLPTDDIPREFRDEFTAIGSSLTAVRPLRGETAVQASIRKMSDHDAAGHAQRIVSLLGALIRVQVQPRQPILRAVNSSDD